ncbi:ABC transporter substrate-binding protein [Georgenia muralis]
MNVRTKILGAATAACLGVAVGAGPATAAPAAVAPSAVSASAHQVLEGPLEVTGTDQLGNDFTGEITDLTAFVDNGVLMVTGSITDTLTGETDTFTTTVDDLFATGDGSGGRGDCQILNLDLGPLDLDVLGLIVELDPIVLDLSADRGPGKLVGNLLCAVTGLLDGGGPLTGVTNLLNRLLTGLGL